MNKIIIYLIIMIFFTVGLFGQSLFDHIRTGTPEEIQAIIEAGADLNARGDHGQTPLMEAAKRTAKPEVISILLEAGADVNARRPDGKTALMMFARNRMAVPSTSRP